MFAYTEDVNRILASKEVRSENFNRAIRLAKSRSSAEISKNVIKVSLRLSKDFPSWYILQNEFS